MLWLRTFGWIVIAVGGFTDPTETGQTIMLLGIVVVLFTLMVSKQERKR